MTDPSEQSKAQKSHDLPERNRTVAPSASNRVERARKSQGRTVVDEAPPDHNRVIFALENAAAVARGVVVAEPAPLVRSIDLEGLGPAELRPRLDEIIVSKHADVGLDALLSTGLLDALLPEVATMVGFGDGEWRHKDVWKHTKQVVIQSVPRLEVRWSALFHDIGKVKTRTISETGEVHFFGHAEVGARMFDKLEKKRGLFRADAALSSTIRFLVLHHLRASGYDESWTDSAVRRFTREMGAHLDDLLCLSRADITTKRPEKKRRGIAQIHALAERVAALSELDKKQPPLPTGIGELLMSEFRLPPCKLIGDIKRALEAACDSGEIEAGRESEYYVDYVTKHRTRFGLLAS